MDVSMQRDENVVFGEDVGYFGGVFYCTCSTAQDKYATRQFRRYADSESAT